MMINDCKMMAGPEESKDHTRAKTKRPKRRAFIGEMYAVPPTSSRGGL